MYLTNGCTHSKYVHCLTKSSPDNCSLNLFSTITLSVVLHHFFRLVYFEIMPELFRLIQKPPCILQDLTRIYLLKMRGITYNQSLCPQICPYGVRLTSANRTRFRQVKKELWFSITWDFIEKCKGVIVMSMNPLIVELTQWFSRRLTVISLVTWYYHPSASDSNCMPPA